MLLKLTATIPDTFDLGPLMRVASSFKVERVPGKSRRKGSTQVATSKVKAVQEREPRHYFKHPKGLTVAEVIMRHYTPSGTFDSNRVSKWLADEGYSPAGAKPSCYRLKLAGFLKQLSPTRYQFLRAGTPKAA